MNIIGVLLTVFDATAGTHISFCDYLADIMLLSMFINLIVIVLLAHSNVCQRSFFRKLYSNSKKSVPLSESC